MADTPTPVSGEVYDIESYSPRSGRVIGEDGELYNLVDLLGGGNTGKGEGFASQTALDNEIANREKAVADKQTQIEALNKEIVATNADLQKLDRSYWGDPEATRQADVDGFRKTTENRLAALEQLLISVLPTVKLPE